MPPAPRPDYVISLAVPGLPLLGSDEYISRTIVGVPYGSDGSTIVVKFEHIADYGYCRDFTEGWGNTNQDGSLKKLQKDWNQMLKGSKKQKLKKMFDNDGVLFAQLVATAIANGDAVPFAAPGARGAESRGKGTGGSGFAAGANGGAGVGADHGGLGIGEGGVGGIVGAAAGAGGAAGAAAGVAAGQGGGEPLGDVQPGNGGNMLPPPQLGIDEALAAMHLGAGGVDADGMPPMPPLPPLPPPPQNMVVAANGEQGGDPLAAAAAGVPQGGADGGGGAANGGINQAGGNAGNNAEAGPDALEAGLPVQQGQHQQQDQQQDQQQQQQQDQHQEWHGRYVSLKQRLSKAHAAFRDMKTKVISMSREFSAMSERFDNVMNTFTGIVAGFDNLRQNLDSLRQSFNTLQFDNRALRARVANLERSRAAEETGENAAADADVDVDVEAALPE